MAKAKGKASGLRVLDANNAKSWNPSGKGASADSGIGNKAVKALQAVNGEFDSVEKVYGSVVKALGSLSDECQRAVLLSAASDFTLGSLHDRSTVTKAYGPRLGTRDLERIEWIKTNQGDKAAEQFESMLLAAKAATAGSKS